MCHFLLLCVPFLAVLPPKNKTKTKTKEEKENVNLNYFQRPFERGQIDMQ